MEQEPRVGPAHTVVTGAGSGVVVARPVKAGGQSIVAAATSVESGGRTEYPGAFASDAVATARGRHTTRIERHDTAVDAAAASSLRYSTVSHTSAWLCDRFARSPLTSLA